MYKLILFDFDGTIVETGEGIINCVKYAMEKMNINRDLTDEQFRSFVGPPLKNQFMDMFGLSEEEGLKAVAFFRERYAKEGVLENNIYNGIEDSLKFLKKKKYKLAIASSKPTVFVKQVLQQHNLEKYFDYVRGAASDGSKDKKEDIIRDVLMDANMENNLQNVIMIGDRKYDCLGAKAIGIKTIGVAYGYGSKSELEEAGALAILDKPEDIITYFANTPLRKEKIIYKAWRTVYPILIHLISGKIAVTIVSLALFGSIFMPSIKEVYDNALMVTAIGGIIALIPCGYLYFQDYKKRQGYKVNSDFGRGKTTIGQKILIIIMAAGVSQLVNILVAILNLYLKNGTYKSLMDNVTYGKSFVSMLIIMGIIGPIVEEVIFRDLIFLRLRAYVSFWPAAIISSVLFGIYHGNLIQAIYAFTLGLLLAWILERTKDITSSMLVHISSNIWALVLAELNGVLLTEKFAMVTLFIMLFVPILGINILRYFSKKGKFIPVIK